MHVFPPIIKTQYDLAYVIPMIGEMIDRFVSEHLIYIFIKEDENFRLVWPSTFNDAMRYGTFQVVATMSTTGYGTANILDWPLFCKVLLLGMMFIGGSAGSTSGGLKISRFVMLMKSGFKGIRSTAFPNRVLSIKMNGKPVSEELLNSTKNYFLLYIWIFVFSVALVCLLPNGNNSFLDLTISVASCFNDIGPGVFGDLHWVSKVVLAFDMLAGRLELFPILLLLYPRAWSRF